LESIVNKKV